MVYIAALDEVEVVFWYSCERGKECVHEGQVMVGVAEGREFGRRVRSLLWA